MCPIIKLAIVHCMWFLIIIPPNIADLEHSLAKTRPQAKAWIYKSCNFYIWVSRFDEQIGHKESWKSYFAISLQFAVKPYFLSLSHYTSWVVKHMLTANCKEIMKLSTVILLWLMIKEIERPRVKSWKGSKYGAFSKSGVLSPIFVRNWTINDTIF